VKASGRHRIPSCSTTFLAAYDAAWNESNVAERARLLARSLTDDAELVEPSGRFRGRQAVDERIAGFSERFPGARVTITSGIDEHHGFARYAWSIGAADGEAILEGIDIVERGEDNRLRRVVMFFGPLPQATG
jgi:SnoaL-like domain